MCFWWLHGWIAGMRRLWELHLTVGMVRVMCSFMITGSHAVAKSAYQACIQARLTTKSHLSIRTTAWGIQRLMICGLYIHTHVVVGKLGSGINFKEQTCISFLKGLGSGFSKKLLMMSILYSWSKLVAVSLDTNSCSALLFTKKVIHRIILLFTRSRLQGRLCNKAKPLLEKFTENHISGVLCYAKQFQMVASGEKLAA